MHVQKRNIALVCNPTVAKAIRLADEVAVRLREKAISFSLFTSYWPTVWAGFTEAWIVGGDGTANFFINQYPDLQLPLALFAGGTGNDLHATLYGQASVAAQIETFLKGHTMLIDAGVCNGTLFLNGIGIGFDGAVVKSLLAKQKRPGKTSYLHSILTQIFLYTEKQCTIAWDAEALTQQCFMISVANGTRYGGGFQVAPKASVTDGLLDVAVIGNVTALQRIRYLPVMERGKHLQLPFVKYQQTGAVSIKATTQLPAHRDGEYFSAAAFDVRCLVKRFAFLR